MIIPATVYKVNKGKGSESYLATAKREYLEGVGAGALLLETLRGERFPTVVRELKNSKGSFTYCFNIPKRVGKCYKNKQKAEFSVVAKNKKGVLGLPEKTIRGFPLYTFDVGEKVLCWIYTKGCKPYAFPREVPLEKRGYSLFELYGAFLCEGFKARKPGKHRDRLSFSNAELSEVKWFIGAAKALFGIQEEEWKAQILFPEESVSTEKRLKSKWSKTGLKPNNIKVCQNQTVAAKNGVCILLIYSSTLAEVFYHIMQQTKAKLFEDEEYCWEFFRGLSRGDLGLTLKPSGAIKVLTFTTENEENMELFQKVCRKIGLTTSKPYFVPCKKGCWEVQIMGHRNFKKVMENNGIVHKKRLQRFVGGFFKSRKSNVYRYLKAVAKGAKTAPRLRDCLGISIVTATALFAKYRREGYLCQVGVGSNNQIIHRLAERGQKALKFYDNAYKG